METSSQSANHGIADLLGLGLDLEFVSPERQRLMADHNPYGGGAMSLVDDMLMDIEMGESQEPMTVASPNSANRTDDERAPRDLDLDHAAPRSIRAPRP